MWLMRNGRATEAWRQTQGARNWGLRFLEATAVVVVTFAGLTWYSPGDRAENVALGLATGLAMLVVTPLVEFGWRYVQLGRPLRELRRVIANELALRGPQELRLKSSLEAAGVSLTPLHLVALRALDADGDIRKINHMLGFDDFGQTQIFDASIEPVWDRFDRST